MAATRLIAMHVNKGRTIAQCLKDRTDYAKNGEKTQQGELVSSYACNAEIADKEFAESKMEYLRLTGRKPKGDIIAYQIRQSFKPGEITPEEANRIGYETAMRFTKGNHAFIVATHTDKAHIHNHIIFNSTNLACDRKFRDSWFIALALQKLSDLVCLENGLSVIKPRKPKSEQLIDKLTSMTSVYEKQQIVPRIYTDDRIKANNPQLYYVIDKLINAVQCKKKVRFQYGEYDANKKKVLRNNGEVYINSPYGCLWSDDFYYLIGFSEKYNKVITFRVDRIVDLEIMDEDIILEPTDFDMAEFANTCIEMFDGELQEVEIICDNEIMKHVIDKFGEGIKTEIVSDEQFKTIVNVAASRTFYAWCFRFAGQMKITGPENVVEEYKEMAQKVLENN